MEADDNSVTSLSSTDENAPSTQYLASSESVTPSPSSTDLTATNSNTLDAKPQWLEYSRKLLETHKCKLDASYDSHWPFCYLCSKLSTDLACDFCSISGHRECLDGRSGFCTLDTAPSPTSLSLDSHSLISGSIDVESQAQIEILDFLIPALDQETAAVDSGSQSENRLDNSVGVQSLEKSEYTSNLLRDSTKIPQTPSTSSMSSIAVEESKKNSELLLQCSLCSKNQSSCFVCGGDLLHPREVFFRCFSCMRTCHFSCLLEEAEESLCPDIADVTRHVVMKVDDEQGFEFNFSRSENEEKWLEPAPWKLWKCFECRIFQAAPTKVLNHHSVPTTVSLDLMDISLSNTPISNDRATSSIPTTPPHPKLPKPRTVVESRERIEYLVRFKGLSHLWIRWVSESWLKSVAPTVWKHYQTQNLDADAESLLKNPSSSIGPCVGIEGLEVETENTDTPLSSTSAPILPPSRNCRLEKKRKIEAFAEFTEIDRVLDAVKDSRGYVALIKWKGCDYDKCTWEMVLREDALWLPFLECLKHLELSNLTNSHENRSRRRNTRGKQTSSSTTAAPFPFEEILTQSSWLKAGTLRDFQLEGLKYVSVFLKPFQPIVLSRILLVFDSFRVIYDSVWGVDGFLRSIQPILVPAELWLSRVCHVAVSLLFL